MRAGLHTLNACVAWRAWPAGANIVGFLTSWPPPGYTWPVATPAQHSGAGELFGNLTGVVGFVLMLMTEILYSLRKRSRAARWGRYVCLAQIPYLTGLWDLYLVLLPPSWKFKAGLAEQHAAHCSDCVGGLLSAGTYIRAVRAPGRNCSDVTTSNRMGASKQSCSALSASPEAAPLARLLAGIDFRRGAGLVFGVVDDANY